MKTIFLNLDPLFKPLGENGIDFKVFDFPSGCEPHIKISPTTQVHEISVVVTCRIRTMNDFFTMLLAIDALKRLNAGRIRLLISYLPFARQDRVMVAGEPLSLKVICELINSQGLFEVFLYDVHSEVSSALINNCMPVSNFHFVKEVLKEKTNYLIVSPDAGAYKKIFKLCQQLNYKDSIVLCNKIRDVSTGDILLVSCDLEDFQGMDLYIVDDICDGGGTFVLLAHELRKRNCGTINLIVSHGIFSRGTELQGINHVYTTNSFRDIENTEKFTQIQLCPTLI